MDLSHLGKLPEAKAEGAAAVDTRAVRMGDIVHLCDGEDCAPAIVREVQPPAIDLLVFARSGGFPLAGTIDHDRMPHIVRADKGIREPSYHTREECPWHR